MKTENEFERRHRAVLLAEAGDVATALRTSGISRSRLYVYLKRFREQGLDGLKDQPTIPKRNPRQSTPETVAAIQQIALQNPAWGCETIAGMLSRSKSGQSGTRVCSVTVQAILNEAGLRSQNERWLVVEGLAAKGWDELTDSQRRHLKTLNPQHLERDRESRAPGIFLCQDTGFAGNFNGIGPVQLHHCVDSYSIYGFAMLMAGDTRKISVAGEGAVALLRDCVLPFYRKYSFRVQQIETGRAHHFHRITHTNKYTVPDESPADKFDSTNSTWDDFKRERRNKGRECLYQAFLFNNGIRQSFAHMTRLESNGYSSRFESTIIDEFLTLKRREATVWDLPSLQTQLQEWLKHYNYRRPHEGYPNYGKAPATVLRHYRARIRLRHR